jgi:hypothetical protein
MAVSRCAPVRLPLLRAELLHRNGRENGMGRTRRTERWKSLNPPYLRDARHSTRTTLSNFTLGMRIIEALFPNELNSPKSGV